MGRDRRRRIEGQDGWVSRNFMLQACTAHPSFPLEAISPGLLAPRAGRNEAVGARRLKSVGMRRAMIPAWPWSCDMSDMCFGKSAWATFCDNGGRPKRHTEA
jgi:hypothetical protein